MNKPFMDPAEELARRLGGEPENGQVKIDRRCYSVTDMIQTIEGTHPQLQYLTLLINGWHPHIEIGVHDVRINLGQRSAVGNMMITRVSIGLDRTEIDLHGLWTVVEH